MSECPSCGFFGSQDAKFCRRCGAKLEREGNYCTTPDCEMHIQAYEFEEQDRYCDLCGKPTTFGKKLEELL